MYDENYYKTLNYADYLSRQERYNKTAQELLDLLMKLSIIDKEKDNLIYDHGCAVGFLIKAFHDLGCSEVYGWDISEWARNEAIKRVGFERILEPSESFTPRVMISLDVFEHMQDGDIMDALEIMPCSLIVRIPCSTDNGKSFHLDVSKRDPTHINCKPQEEWINFIKCYGSFDSCFKLNLLTIYNSPGVFCALFTR